MQFIQSTVDDLLKYTGSRKLPVVEEKATIEQIVNRFVQSCHTRIVYVLDATEALLGIITLGDLVQHVFFHYHGRDVEPSHLVAMATRETASDFMRKELVAAKMEDNLEEVLKEMLERNVKEIPVIDDQQHLVGDVTLIDIMGYMEAVDVINDG